MKGLTLILTLGLTILAFGQKRLSGTWKSTNGLARHIYRLDTSGKVIREFYSDLWYYKLEGQYIISGDTIKINYNEPTDQEKVIYFRNKTPNLTDTIYIVNSEKLKMRGGKYSLLLYNKNRDERIFNIDDTGKLTYKVRNFDDTLLLQQFRFNKWTTFDTITSFNSKYFELLDYQLPVHSGLNKYRIRIIGQWTPYFIKQFEFVSTCSKVKLINKTITDSIYFNSSTYYELYNSSGKLISKGVANRVDCTTLESGVYYINYDNETTKIKKK